MFRHLKRRFKEFVNKKSHLTETSKIIINDHQEKKIENILSYEERDNLIKLQILSECTFEEYVDSINKYEKDGNSIEIPIRMFITNGGNLINTKLKKQKIFVVSRDDITYYVVISNGNIKLSERMYQGDEINEITLKINKNSNEYTIFKYVHDLTHSTKFCKWYPIRNANLSNCALNRSQAIELFKIFLLNLKKISDMKIFSDIENLYDLASSIGISIFSDGIEENSNDLKDSSKSFPKIVDSQVDSIVSYHKKR